jgi:hypothetical protein
VSKKSSRSHYSAAIISRSRTWLTGAISIFTILASVGTSHAASLSTASLSVSDPRPSAAAATYTFTGSNETLTLIKCIKAVYADTPTGNNVPLGMSTASATLDTANTNYIPTPASWTLNHPVNGTLSLTNAAGETPASAAARKVVFANMTNSSVADTKFFVRMNTYNNTDCATSPIDNVTVGFILTNGSTLSLTVDQTLTFSVNAVSSGQTCNGATSTANSTATTIPFGTVSAAANSVVCQDLTAATNATNGYTIYARYTAKPTNSIGQTISDTTGTNTTPAAFPAAGTEAYGYTTNDANLGTGVAGRFVSGNWAAMSTTNSEVAYEPNGVTNTTYRVGHQVGVSLTTRPGTYQTTIIYTCTPVY